MSVTTITKSGTSDDSAPSSVAPDPSRVFVVPAFMPGAQVTASGRVILYAQILTGAGASVAAGTYSAALWLKIGGTWVQKDITFTLVGHNKKVSFSFGALATDTEATIRVTSVTGTGAASVKLFTEVMEAAASSGNSVVATDGTDLAKDSTLTTFSAKFISALSGVTAGVVSTWTSIVHVLPFSRFLTTRTGLANGEGSHLQASKYGGVLVKDDQPKEMAAVTPNDATTLDFNGGLWVGTGGNVIGRLKDNAASVTLSNVPSGSYLPGHWVRVDTATTATNIVGFKE